jgi:hypothetical protein
MGHGPQVKTLPRHMLMFCLTQRQPEELKRVVTGNISMRRNHSNIS